MAPVAVLSADALRANAPRSLSSSGDDVLAADAWGHGATWVASVLADLGMDADALDPTTLYGLPGARTRP
ncbi:hypothetical protein HR12_35810 [Microbacterium sp. SUBG005]|nr:hypothetical protein HR12_35810 [Microbacterium sp. SUBG005]